MDKVNGIDPIQNCHIAEEASWEIRNGGRATRNWNIQREGESERERGGQTWKYVSGRRRRCLG